MTSTSDQTIYVTASGPEYTFPRTIRETNGKNISGDTVTVGLGGFDTPPTLAAPTVDTAQSDPSTRVVQLLVTNATAPGKYYLWVKVTDNPEAPIRRTPGVINVV